MERSEVLNAGYEAVDALLTRALPDGAEIAAAAQDQFRARLDQMVDHAQFSRDDLEDHVDARLPESILLAPVAIVCAELLLHEEPPPPSVLTELIEDACSLLWAWHPPSSWRESVEDLLATVFDSHFLRPPQSPRPRIERSLTEQDALEWSQWVKYQLAKRHGFWVDPDAERSHTQLRLWSVAPVFSPATGGGPRVVRDPRAEEEPWARLLALGEEAEFIMSMKDVVDYVISVVFQSKSLPSIDVLTDLIASACQRRGLSAENTEVIRSLMERWCVNQDLGEHLLTPRPEFEFVLFSSDERYNRKFVPRAEIDDIEANELDQFDIWYDRHRSKLYVRNPGSSHHDMHDMPRRLKTTLWIVLRHYDSSVRFSTVRQNALRADSSDEAVRKAFSQLRTTIGLVFKKALTVLRGQAMVHVNPSFTFFLVERADPDRRWN